MATLDVRETDEKEEISVPNSLINKPDFEANTEAYPFIAKYSLKSDKDIRNIETAFNTFAKIINNRKEECLKFANNNVNNYKKIKSKSKSNDKKPKYETLILDFENNKNELKKIGTKIGELEYSLKIEEKECITKTREYFYYEDYNKKARKEYSDWEKLIEKEEHFLNGKKENYKEELQQVLPGLAEITKKLAKINDNELDSYHTSLEKNPPPMVRKTIKGINLFLGNIERSKEKYYKWEEVKKIVQQNANNKKKEMQNKKQVPKKIEYLYIMINDMLSFHFDINDEKSIENRDYIISKFIKNEDLVLDNAKKCDKITAIFVSWINKTIELTKTRERVKPLENEIDELSKKKTQKEKEGKKLVELISENEKKMNKIHDDIRTLTNKINIIRDEIELQKDQNEMNSQ